MSALDPAVQRQIDTLGIAHEVVDCDPALADTEQFCANYNIPPDHAANTILVAIKTEPRQYVACLVLATTRLDVNHKLAKIAGTKRLSFASADETKSVTGQLIGGVTVFGLPEAIPLYVDALVMERQWIIVGGGNRSTKVRLAPAELRKLPNARVEDIASIRSPGPSVDAGKGETR